MKETAPQVFAEVPLREAVWSMDMPGPYVSLVHVIIAVLPFFCMLIGTTNDMFEARAERDMYKGQIEELLGEMGTINSRIEALHTRMDEGEKSLQREYQDMMRIPPRWPFDTLTEDIRPPVYVPWWVRRRYDDYLTSRSKEGYPSYPRSTEPLTGSGTDGELAPAIPLRRDR